MTFVNLTFEEKDLIFELFFFKFFFVFNIAPMLGKKIQDLEELKKLVESRKDI